MGVLERYWEHGRKWEMGNDGFHTGYLEFGSLGTLGSLAQDIIQ